MSQFTLTTPVINRPSFFDQYSSAPFSVYLLKVHRNTGNKRLPENTENQRKITKNGSIPGGGHSGSVPDAEALKVAFKGHDKSLNTN